jgi:hypothetical protein
VLVIPRSSRGHSHERGCHVVRRCSHRKAVYTTQSREAFYPFLGRPCVSCVVSCVESWMSAARSEAAVISHLAMDFSYVAC